MAKKPDSKKIASAGADQYMLRLPPGMRDAVSKLAESNGRSMNTEIVAAIEQHLKGPSRMDAVEAFIAKYGKTIDRVDEIADWLVDDLYEEVEKLKRTVSEIDPRPIDDD